MRTTHKKYLPHSKQKNVPMFLFSKQFIEVKIGCLL
jgi:hypothetical protein